MSTPFTPRLFATCLLAASLAACTPQMTRTIFGPISHPQAEAALQAHLDALKSITTLQANVVCVREMVDLDTPLVDHGKIVIARPDQMHFSITTPFVSETVLTGTKQAQRTQHELDWTRQDQSTRPGLNMMLAQIEAWSMGNLGKMKDFFTVTWAEKPLESPVKLGFHVPETETFLLTSKDPEMQKTVQSLTIAFDAQTHHLRAVRILTKLGDATTYWFSDPVLNATLPPDIFLAK